MQNCLTNERKDTIRGNSEAITARTRSKAKTAPTASNQYAPKHAIKRLIGCAKKKLTSSKKTNTSLSCPSSIVATKTGNKAPSGQNKFAGAGT